MDNLSRPPLGETNRYQNAQTINPQFAEEINRVAVEIVKESTSVLEELRKNPSLRNFHNSKTGGQWMGPWIIEKKKYILANLYGVIQINGLSGIPPEVENFVKNVYQVVEN